MSEYFGLTELSSSEQRSLLRTHRASDVIRDAIELWLRRGRKVASATACEDIFLAALASAGIHMEAVSSAQILEHDNMHSAISDHLAIIIRYANAVGNSLESSSERCGQTAFVFDAVHVMISVAIKNMKLFLTLDEHFEQLRLLLHLLDIYLEIPNRTTSIDLMFAQVIGSLVRFCGLATRYLKGLAFKVLAKKF